MTDPTDLIVQVSTVPVRSRDTQTHGTIAAKVGDHMNQEIAELLNSAGRVPAFQPTIVDVGGVILCIITHTAAPS